MEDLDRLLQRVAAAAVFEDAFLQREGIARPPVADEFTRMWSVPYFSSMSTARFGEHFVIGYSVKPTQ